MQAAREFVGHLAERVSIPAVYGEIRRLILDPRATIDDSVDIIAGDSMLALRVRRMASSEYFGIPRPCHSLRQASEIIGLMQLHDLVLALLCMRTFSGVPGELFDFRGFWRHAVRCGIAARAIGRQIEGGDNNIYFSLGLFAEIGHAAMYLEYPEDALRALDQSEARQCPLVEVERELLGFDYCQLGAELARLWQLPPAYEQAAAFHLQPQLAEPTWREAVSIVQLAHRHCQGPTVTESSAARPDIGADAGAIAGRLPENIAESLAAEISTWSEAVLALLWPRAEVVSSNNEEKR